MPRLSSSTLQSLGGDVPIPAYDRSAVTPGIVHFGVGGFHRAHQAMYVDRLLSEGAADDWGIAGIGVLPSDARMRDVMRDQDCLYTLVLRHPDGSLEPRVIGSIVEYLFAPDDPEAVLARLAAPSTRIVSLTVTEGGYSVDRSTGELDAASPALAADLAPGAVPASAFGLIVEALARRRAAGTPPFTVASCDNIPGNGELAHRMISAFARLRDPGLGEWVEREVSFPNSMVDRITPGTTPADVALVADRFGIDDAWPVVCEPFTQWVLEDRFGAAPHQGRPPLEDVGVQVVEDVEPYELMKLRLLNASHQALCYFAFLAGYELVHDAASDPLWQTFLRWYMDDEATPTLPPVPGVDLEDYRSTLIERFANPGVRDTVARLCAESSDRIPQWLLPVVRLQLAADRDVSASAAIVASWARYAEGRDEAGKPITVVDRLAEQLVATAQRQWGPGGEGDIDAFIADRHLFGDLVDDPRFVEPYRAALRSLHEVGARATLEALVKAR